MSRARMRAGGSVSAVAALALSAMGLAALPASADEEPTTPETIDIVAISDFHGHIENASKLATYVNDARAANPGNTFFVSNGDSVGGSAFVSSIAEDNPTMDILNAMELDLSSTGNHEYDRGVDDLTGRIAKRVNFPYLVSNVDGIDKDVIAPFDIRETADGTTVAFIGAVTDQVPTLVSPAGVAGLNFNDPVAAVDGQAALLKDGDTTNGEADIVIALIHETITVSDTVGSNVDAVIAGHTHHDESSTTKSGAPVIEPGSFGQFAGHVTLTYNGEKVTDAQAKVQCIEDLSDPKDPTIPVCDEPAEDTAIDAMYQEALAESETLGARQVGTIVGGADRATNNGTKADLGSNRGSEMTGGNLIAQAFYEYSQSMSKPADFGIMNPGGVRADTDADNDGIVTFKESYSAQPFGNSYGTVDITGAQVYQMLEEQWADASTQTSRPMLALGLSDSISFTYNADADFGSHIKQVFINNELVDPSSTELYTVASNAFLLAGGDGFNVFKAGVNYSDTGIIDNDVFNDFLADNPGYVVDDAQRNIAITGEDALEPGETATIDLASLSMTYEGNKQTLPETVDVSLIGDEGKTLVSETSDIDNSVTPNLNETGQASVDLDIPADVEPGSYLLVIEAGPTVFELPADVTEEPVPTSSVEFEGISDGDVVKRGQEITASVLNAAEYSEAVLSWHSDPVTLASGNVGADGSVTLVGKIPADAEAGAHTLVVTLDGEELASVSVTLEVTAEPEPEPTDQPTTGPSNGASDGGSSQPTSSPSNGSTTQPGKDLPNTGANVAGFVVVALMLVTAGGVLVARRKTDQV